MMTADASRSWPWLTHGTAEAVFTGDDVDMELPGPKNTSGNGRRGAGFACRRNIIQTKPNG